MKNRNHHHKLKQCLPFNVLFIFWLKEHQKIKCHTIITYTMGQCKWLFKILIGFLRVFFYVCLFPRSWVYFWLAFFLLLFYIGHVRKQLFHVSYPLQLISQLEYNCSKEKKKKKTGQGGLTSLVSISLLSEYHSLFEH